MSFLKNLFKSKNTAELAPTRKRMIVCQNSACRETYDLDHIVTVSDEDLMSFTSAKGALVVGNLTGHPILVDHSKTGANTSENDLKTFLDSAPKVGWTCGKCKTDNSWNASYQPQAILRNAELKYYTGDNYAAWGTGHSKVFDLSEYDPQPPASSLKHLLDGTLYDIPRPITSDTCREVILRHLSEAATALKRAQGRATEAEAAILTVIKLKLSVAVRNSETWDSAESRIDRIIRS